MITFLIIIACVLIGLFALFGVGCAITLYLIWWNVKNETTPYPPGTNAR